MKNKPLTKKQRSDLLDAWSELNVLCAYYKDKKESTHFFTENYDPQEKVKEIYKLIDSIINTIDDSDLD